MLPKPSQGVCCATVSHLDPFNAPELFGGSYVLLYVVRIASYPNAVFQNCFYVGNTFNAILYGVELVLYFISIRIILSLKDRRTENRRFSLDFSTALLLLITIYVAIQAVFAEEMWIVHADYPGGSARYRADNAAVWYQTLGSAATIVLINLLSNGLILYRCFVVWNDLCSIVVPGILYLATGVLGVLTCYVSGKPNANFFVGKAQVVAVAYSSVAIALNVFVSALICMRIVFLAKQVSDVLGSEVAKAYTGAAALVIESALPYTLFGIADVVSLGLKSLTSILFLSIYVIAYPPQMSVLRALMGRAWSSNSAIRTHTRVEFTCHTCDIVIVDANYTSAEWSTTLNMRTVGRHQSSQQEGKV
ncbi:hypothetical protein BD414DRAFT_517062 [Trametes punicea]|nr:hypothetical protein BD414DRAFT_517062 [Trametes punicea]